MLNYKEGLKIARIKSKDKENKYVYLDDKFDWRKTPEKHLTKKFFKKHKKMKESVLTKVMDSLKDGIEPEDESLRDIYYDAQEDIIDSFKNGIRLKKGEKMVPLPNKHVVEKVYVTGISGAGKSHWSSRWLVEYFKMFKDDEYFLISTVDDDKVLDDLNPVRIPLNDSILEIRPEELRNSVVMFDDTDSIRDKPLRKAVGAFRDNLLEIGRHFNTRMLITSHLVFNFHHTRRVLNEATSIVFFPGAGSTYQIRRFLKVYAGLDPNQIKKILNLPSRWVVLHRTYPNFVLYEKGVYML